MRFNQDDLRRGNVSKERIQEIVMETILKLDERKFNLESVNRIGMTTANNVEKIFLFKRNDTSEKEDIEKYNYEYNLNNLQFFNKLTKANLELIKLERNLDYFQQQELQKSILEKTQELNALKEQKRLHETAFQAQIHQLHDEMIQQLMNQRRSTINRIEQLLNHRNNLIQSIKEREKAIQASRKVHETDALKYINEVQVDDVETFKGMTEKNQEKFVKGYFALQEIKTRNLTKIDLQIQAEREALHANGKSTGMLTSYKSKYRSSPKIEKLEDQKRMVKEIFEIELGKLGDITGNKHINSNAIGNNPDNFKNHLSAFENQAEIKKHIDAHIEVTREQVKEIRKEELDIIEINDEILKEIQEVKKIDINITDVSSLNGAKLKTLEELSSVFSVNDFISALNDSSFDFNLRDLEIDLELDNNQFEVSEKSSIDLNDLSLKKLDIDNIDLSELNIDELNFGDESLTIDTSLTASSAAKP